MANVDAAVVTQRIYAPRPAAFKSSFQGNRMQECIRRGWIAAILFVVALPGAAAAQPQPVRGTRVELQPPAGFAPADRFPGFQLDGTGASIMVTDVAGPFSQMSAGLTPEGLARGGMTLISADSVAVGAQPGRLLNLTQSAQGIAFEKWVLMFGGDSATAVVTATYPLEHADSLRGPMRQAVLSARWSGRTLADPLEGIGFTVDPGRLRIAHRIGNTVAINESGTLPNTDPAAPLLVVGASISEVDLSELETFAAARLLQMPGVSNVADAVTTRLAIHGADAYEMIADAVEAQTRTPLKVYQVIIAEGGHYMLVQGYVGAGRAEEFIPQFKAIARSVRRTQ